jgi:ribonuclease HI
MANESDKNPNIKKLVIAADACCKVADANKKGHYSKGKCACGVIYFNNEKKVEFIVHQFGQYLGEMTVNEAEYNGLINALDSAAAYCRDQLEIWLDSELVVKHLNGQYRLKAVNLKPLFDRVKSLERRFNSVSYFHHGRENEAARLADKMANDTLKQNL